eukprot:5903865-Pleurochrysis_carterae.AAC.1
MRNLDGDKRANLTQLSTARALSANVSEHPCTPSKVCDGRKHAEMPLNLVRNDVVHKRKCSLMTQRVNVG